MSSGTVDLALIDAVERASLQGWAPTYVDELDDGWILRATPGIGNGRSCHALTPRVRSLRDGELADALLRIRAWSATYGIRGGIQVSPLEVHAELVPRLAAHGWEPLAPVRVMIADRVEALERGVAGLGSAPGVGDALDWVSVREADDAWRANWLACSPHLGSEVIDAHAATVFGNVGTRGVYGRLGDAASGIAVEDPAGEWAGLFALVVAEDRRGQGLGRRLILSLLADLAPPRIYLQVVAGNTVAVRLYESLGFRQISTYQHVLAPQGWATGV